MTSINNHENIGVGIHDFDFYKKNAWANKIGIRMHRITSDRVSLFLPYTDKNLNVEGGVVHGGVIGTMLQDAGFLLSCQCFPQVAPENILLLDTQINYLSGARKMDLTASAELTHSSGSFAFIHATVVNDKQLILAHAHLIYRIAEPGEQANDLDVKDLREKAFGPKLEMGEVAHVMREYAKKHTRGLLLTGYKDDQVRFQLENLPENRDSYGFLSHGAELIALDDAAVFCSYPRIKIPGVAATVDLKISYCDRVKDENVIAFGHCLKHQNQIINNQMMMFGETSRKLVAFGTMTFWGA